MCGKVAPHKQEEEDKVPEECWDIATQAHAKTAGSHPQEAGQAHILHKGVYTHSLPQWCEERTIGVSGRTAGRSSGDAETRRRAIINEKEGRGNPDKKERTRQGHIARLYAIHAAEVPSS